MFMQDEERRQACEDGLKGQEDGGVGGREMLLGPALDGEGCGRCEEAGYGQGDEEAGSDGKVGFSAQWQGDRHDERGYADLEGGELAGWDSVGCVGEGEEVAGEGDRTGQGEEVSGANADEEVLHGCPGWRGEEEEAGEGEDRSDGSCPARWWGIRGSESGNDREEWDEDDDEAGDEGGFGGCGAGEAGGLELIARGEEEADD